MSYDLGAIVPLSVTITDADGDPADATQVNLTITLPDGTTDVTSNITPTSTGIYDHDYPTVQAGRHLVRWVATGVNAGAFTNMFEVLPAAPPQIISLRDAKKQLNIPQDSTGDDDEILDFVRATTAVCERYVGAISRTAHTETFDGGKTAVLLGFYPVLTVTSVTENGTTLGAGDYTITAASGVLGRVNGYSPWLFLPGVKNVTVAYVAGTTATAANVGQAARIILQHMWETQRPAGGGPFSQQGEEFDPRYLYSIPRRALELLGEPIGGLA
jgi:hypothetical protein